MKYIIAVIILGILVAVHEFGHFVIAKRNNVMVKEFSIGLGPKLFSIKRGETRYSLRVVPVGGACTMLGGMDDVDEVPEDETDEEREKRIELTEGRSFGEKPVWSRIAILLAGPFFNFLLALVLAVIVIGFVGYDSPYLTEVDEKSPAYAAGLREGDLILVYNGSPVSFGREMYLNEYINPIKSENDLITVTYERDGKHYNASFSPLVSYKTALGISYYATEDEPTISSVMEGSPIANAGVMEGDVIVSVNGAEITSGLQFNEYMNNNPINEDSELNLVLKRGRKQFEANVKPAFLTYYNTGFAYNLTREQTTPIKVISYGVRELGYQVSSVYKSLGMMFTGRLSVQNLSGPVGVLDVISDTYEEAKPEGAFMVLLNLANITIMLSANLGVMNLLPIPALDGGRLLFCIIEIIRRKPVSPEREGIVHFVGMAFLFALMIFILFNDISRL